MSVCDQIVFAAEALQYVELSDGAMPPGTSSYDMDTGTPDHMTSSSDPGVVQVHVPVEQEMPMAGSTGVTVAPSGDSEARSWNAAELRVVYLATAADTSCVSQDDDGQV